MKMAKAGISMQWRISLKQYQVMWLKVISKTLAWRSFGSASNQLEKHRVISWRG